MTINTEKKIHYRAVHTKTVWRRANNFHSVENALHGKSGASALFAHKAQIDYSIHGEPLYVVIWEEGPGSSFACVVRPSRVENMIIEWIEISVEQANSFDAKKGSPPKTSQLAEIFDLAHPGEIHLGGENLPDRPHFLSSESAMEGARELVLHFRRERNPRLAKSKLEAALTKNGMIACEVCGFDFSRTYGPEVGDLCEVHHLKPIGERYGAEITGLDDLAILCPNCHRAIHRTNPMCGVPEFAEFLKNRSADDGC